MRLRTPQFDDDQEGAGLQGFSASLLRNHYAALTLLSYGCLVLLYLSPAEDVAVMWRSGSWWLVVLVAAVILACAWFTFHLCNWKPGPMRWLARCATSVLPPAALAYALFFR